MAQLLERRGAHALRPPSEPAVAPRKHAPTVGAKVLIRVLHRDPYLATRFYCKIEDPIYEGEGYIDTYQKGGTQGIFRFDPNFVLESFYHEGRPLLFKAEVVSLGKIENDKQLYFFSALHGIDQCIQDEVQFGEEADCKIFFIDHTHKVYLGTTEYGYSIFLPFPPDERYEKGDEVRIRLTDASNPRCLQGAIIGEATEEVDLRFAAEELLLHYADEKTYEPSLEEQEDTQAINEEQLPISYVEELIHLLDHKALLETQEVKAYAFLAIAHILARMIDHEEMAEYLHQRQALLCLLKDYGTNGRVDETKLKNLSTQHQQLFDQHPLLKHRIEEVHIANSFGKPEQNHYLWAVLQQHEAGHKLHSLAQLVLSYNLTQGQQLENYEDALTEKIKSLLNIRVKLPTIHHFGEESQVVEFKTSLVYPPDGSRKPDLQQQTFNILKIIGGMANAYGGTLYIGVRDSGTAKGLQDDLEHFEQSKDKFDNYLRNQIKCAFGLQFNANVMVEYPAAGEHLVYALKVKASARPCPLKMGEKELYFHRQGASTYEISLPQLEKIMAQRDFSNYPDMPLPKPGT